MSEDWKDGYFVRPKPMTPTETLARCRLHCSREDGHEGTHLLEYAPIEQAAEAHQPHEGLMSSVAPSAAAGSLDVEALAAAINTVDLDPAAYPPGTAQHAQQVADLYNAAKAGSE